jgi:lysozyme family protein
MTFEQAFERLIGHEGGYVSAESARRNNDPGGETKYGISKRSYPGEDIAGLTLDRAREIYRRDYWGPAGCDAVPHQIKFDLFDMAVNSGVRTAVRMLQGVVGETQDGIIGPRSLQAIQSMPAARLVARFNGERLEFMTRLQNWPENSRGWARRIAANLKAA